MDLSLEANPSSDDLKALDQGLTAHALDFTRTPGFQPLAAFVRDERFRIVAGVYGRINWGWLHVSRLWVDPNHRGRGWGARLLERLEAAAVAHGCSRAHLDTFSYQAPDFYRRRGYVVFAALDDYPPGHQRVFMHKRLNAVPKTAPIE